MFIKIGQPLAFSYIGQKDNQEDCIFPLIEKMSVKHRYFILCDGMGGHDNGEVASATVCNALGEYFRSYEYGGLMTVDIFNAALDYAYDELDKKDTGSIKKMGTTMACLYFHKNGYLVAHIGDSRIYHIRPKSGIIYQSSDHSLVNDLLRAGELTEEEAINFPKKNVITRAMQPNLERRHKADVFSFSDIQKGDYFFMCSDGVLEQLTNDKLCEILSNKKLTDADKLEAIKQVCEGKTKDNYSCYLIPIAHVEAEPDDMENSDDNIVASIEIEEPEQAQVSKIDEAKECTPKVKPKWWKKIVGYFCVVLVALIALLGIWKFVLSTDKKENIVSKVDETSSATSENIEKSANFNIQKTENKDSNELVMKVVDSFIKKDSLNADNTNE